MPKLSTKIAVDEIIESELGLPFGFVEYIDQEIFMLNNSFKTIPYFVAFYVFNVGHYEQWKIVEQWDCEYLVTTFNNERGDICWLCDVESFKIRYPF